MSLNFKTICFSRNFTIFKELFVHLKKNYLMQTIKKGKNKIWSKLYTNNLVTNN